MTGRAVTQFVALLHLSDATETAVNLRGAGSALDTYIRCAALAQASADRAGTALSLVTNKPDAVGRAGASLGIVLPAVLEQTFARTVAAGLPFFSAHFKLDVIAAMGRGNYGPHAGLIDIDAVFLRPPPPAWFEPETLLAYDITAQVSAEHGSDRIRTDLERVAGRSIPAPRWFGGECLLGPSPAFADLSRHIEACWPRYLAAVGSLHHVGDEAVVSAALNIAIMDGMPVTDLGADNQLVRWWSARTGYRQVPFSTASRATLLHLPSDKPFLASQAGPPFDPATFLARYRRRAGRKLLVRRIYTLAEMLGSGRSKHVARMR